MINVENSKYSRLNLTEVELDRYRDSANEYADALGFNKPVMILISRYCNDEDLENKFINTRFIISYLDKNNSTGKMEFTFDSKDDCLLDLKKIILACQKQVSCTHDLDYRKDENGNIYPDGRSKCKKCGIEYDRGMPIINDRRIISMSLGDDISSTFNWGDTYVQGGRSGIVIRRKPRGSYRTAFIEAFPKIDGLSTFIRGEGNNVLEAEANCWAKFQKMRDCDSHEWSRRVNKNNEDECTTGKAICLKCGMKADALEPLTKCFVCNKPTTLSYKDKHICWKHYFEEDKMELFKYEEKILSESIFKDTKNQMEFDFFLRYQVEKLWFDKIGEEKFDKFYDRIGHIYVFFSHKMLRLMFNHNEISESDDYPSMNDKKLIEALNYFESKMDDMLDFVLGKEKSISNDCLIHKKYFR